MRIKVVSDLHLEFSDIDIPNQENIDVLILSGDIMIAEDLYDHQDKTDFTNIHSDKSNRVKRFRDFLTRCSTQYPHVIYVAGNHEFYHGKIHAGVNYLRTECAKYPNVYFLEKDTKIINDVVFVGGTLWTDMNKGDPLTKHYIRSMMNDFKIIRNDKKGYIPFSPTDAVDIHQQTKQYFDLVLSENKDKTCVVVGHHCPSFQSCHPQYADEPVMNGGYHSNLEEFILNNPQVKLWTCGHTHHAHWYYLGETLIVCNPRGYESGGGKENTGWNPGIVIDLNNMPDKDYVSENYGNLF